MLDWLFNTDQFIPRRICGNWSDGLVWLHNLSDLAIFASYMTIPVFLLYFKYKKNIQGQPVKRIIWLFALFILGCGATHLMGFIVFTYPAYHLDGVVKLFTAIVSIITVIALIPSLSKLLAMKTTEEFEKEIAHRKAIEQEITEQKEHLEKEVEQQLSGVREVNILLKKQMEERQAISDELLAQTSDLRALQDATVKTCAILDSLMQLAPVGMAFFDCNGRYIRINNWLAKINGQLPDEHIGKSIDDISPNVASKMKARLLVAMGSTTPIVDDEVSVSMDKNRIFLVSYYPVFTPDSKRLGTGVVVKDITEQKQLESELRKSVVEVTHSDRQKTEFLAMLAHELRNPLSPILNSVYLLNSFNKEADPHFEERRHAFQVIGRQVQHMSRLLDDLLDIARINKGKIRLRKEIVDVNRLLKRVIDLHKSSADVRHHETILSLSPQMLATNADPTRLEQVFGNIYSNAIKYTEQGGRIEVKTNICEDDENWIVVSIKDNGIGMSGQTLPRLFEIFSQATQSLDREQGGLGIGLALSKDLVCMHGGKIEAKSEGLGCGSEFIIKLPLIFDHNLTVDSSESCHIPVSNKPLRILIVDDNVDVVESLSILLTHSGHDVQMVLDGATALKKLGAYNPNVILLDIGLPGLDGFTCCELLRESSYTGLIVAITGYGSEIDRNRSKEAGFNYHLTKPVNPVELAQILNDYADTLQP